VHRRMDHVRIETDMFHDVNLAATGVFAMLYVSVASIL
jgi:hypothetical protein